MAESPIDVPFDYELLLRNDSKAVQKIQDSIARCAAHGGPFANPTASKAFTETLRNCRHNLSSVIPFFYKYPKDKPMSLIEHSPFYPVFQLGRLVKMVLIGGRQIAKSSSIAARQILKAHIFSGYNITYLAPRFEQTKTFAARLRLMLSGYTYRSSLMDKGSPNAMFYKEFLNKSSILLTYALTNVDRTRGRSTDDLDLDEVQDLDSSHLNALLELMQASSWKNVTYSGTAKSVDTTLEALWQESSMAERILPCTACNRENVPNLANNVMDLIQRDGLRCVKCGRPLDIDKAFWQHAYPERADEGPGYHIPQIILPAYVKDPIQWRSIYKKKMTTDYQDFISEGLGISTDTGSREINENDLKNACLLGDNIKKLHKECTRKKYTYIISGLDWGGSDYQPMLKTKKSYTVHTILGVRNPEDVDVLYFKRYAGMDLESIAGSILLEHERFNGTHLASDFGAGTFYNWMIRKKVNIEMHYIFDYSSSVLKYIQVPETAPMENQITLNRTESISFLFHKIKKKHIKFARWEIVHEYLKEFMAVYRAPGELASGRRIFLYRKQGNRTDDSLHSVNFAYTLTRILYGEISLHDPEIEKNQPPKIESLTPEVDIRQVMEEDDAYTRQETF